MRKYTYNNATVYITEPTEEQIANIHKATERFARKLVKKGIMKGGKKRRNRRRVSVTDTNAR